MVINLASVYCTKSLVCKQFLALYYSAVPSLQDPHRAMVRMYLCTVIAHEY